MSYLRGIGETIGSGHRRLVFALAPHSHLERRLNLKRGAMARPEIFWCYSFKATKMKAVNDL